MKSRLTLSIFVLVALLSMAHMAVAQTNYQFRTPASETGGFMLPAPAGPDGNYFLDDNWYASALSLRFVPDVTFGNGERSYIENGGTAIVNSTGADTGQLVLASAGSTTGALEVQAGGVLHSRIAASTNGAITVGSSAGIGTLRVLPGGTLTGEGSLSQGTNPGNLVRVGGLTGAAATLSTNSAILPAQVQVFPNAAFSTAGGTAFLGNSVYTSEITGNGVNGKIDVGATATLGGSLVLNFNGYAPSVGHSWNVLEAVAYSGEFASVTSNATLASNQNFVVSKPSVGGGQLGYNLSLQEVMVLEVNRDTGAVKLKHPGSSAIQLDGYFIGSDNDALLPAGWNSWKSAGAFGGGWLETAPTTSNLAELKPTGDGTVPGGNVTNFAFGNVFNPVAGPFGQNNENIEFEYRRSSDGAKFPGRIEYVGTRVNTLLLQVDPTGAGAAYLRNTSDETVFIDSYDVLSADGSLTTSGWNSFDEQNFEGANTWLEVGSNANQIGEVNQSGFTQLAPGATLSLGALYNGGTKDLALSFLLMGNDTPSAGRVMYQAFSPVAGDYNNNGIVDAADYTLWRNHLGENTPLLNTDPADVDGVVTQAEYTYWKSRFGATTGAGAGGGGLASTAAPEPATWLLIALAGFALGMFGGRQRSPQVAT